MTIHELIREIEQLAPLNYQESYDNAGLIIGNRNESLTGVLIALDVTEAVVEEAIQKKRNLILAHHPIIFKGLKKLTGSNYVERIVMKAIRHGIAIYAAHTNLDNVLKGVNHRIGQKLGLDQLQILSPRPDDLLKLVVFVPHSHADSLKQAIFEAGAGTIGKYDSCSFSAEGQGSFRAGNDANPYVGSPGKFHLEPEMRVETVLPTHRKRAVLAAMKAAHPYEEVAYDLYRLENENPLVGSGMQGTISPMSELNFLQLLKDQFGAVCIRHSQLLGKEIRKVAFCGGSGSFLIKEAIAAGADVFVTGDIKYHDFFDADNKILLVDLGHFESEQFTQELFYQLIIEKFPNIAVDLAQAGANPVFYF